MEQVLERSNGGTSPELLARPKVSHMKPVDIDEGRITPPGDLQERLKARRTELNMSQGDVAQKITFWNNKAQEWKKLSRSAYCMYESGEVTPDLDKIERLAKVLHCTPEWLAFGTVMGDTKTQVEEMDYDESSKDFAAKRFWDLDVDWVRTRFDAQPEDIALAMVNDFSPNLKPGDLAVVRKGIMPTVTGGEFVYAQDDEIKVAHVTRPNAKGGYRIYEPDLRTHVDLAEGGLQFLGKVVGKMGDL